VPDAADDTPEAADALITAPAHAAWARVRWPGGAVVASNLPARLDEPVHAGSIFKLVVARAALAQGIVTRETRIACRRQLTVHGRRVDCVHPDLGRPLTLDDALAHSCNHYVVRIAARLDRDILAATLRRLSGGSLSLIGEAPLPLIALGLDGPTAGMHVWTRVALAAMSPDADRAADASLVPLGAVRAVSDGTAHALDDATTLTLAKTGTTMPDGGGQEGRVVAWRPEIGEAIVVRAPGVPGRDAARLARAVWDAAASAGEPRVRVGRVRDSEVGRAAPAVETVPLEAYVAGVVAAEGERNMGPVALQALAIVARSYARAPSSRHRRDGYDVCDTTHCQVWGSATPWSRDAAARTRGMVLARGAAVVAVPYSASCSGVLVSPRDVWGGDEPVITRTGRDPADHPVEQWRGDIDARALLSVLREAGHRGDHLRDVRVSARTADGVPTRVALDGLAPGEIDATTFRHLVGRRLGWDRLKSHAWDVTRTARGYQFTGRGKGHGAGMCVRGASVLGARGWSLGRVLSAYAPGASIHVPADRVTMRVPAAISSDVPQLRASATSMLADLRALLGVSTSRDVEIVVHPTREAFQRVTGRAWWTSASTRHLGGTRYRMDLAPPSEPTSSVATLEQGSAATRGGDGLMTALRHEAVHVLTAPALEWAPAWAAEGLAQAVSRGSAPHHADSVPVCPTDAEVTRPGSLETMRAVYARSAACVAAALPDGLGTWRQLATR
jgi:stage II sporulation protein D